MIISSHEVRLRSSEIKTMRLKNYSRFSLIQFPFVNLAQLAKFYKIKNGTAALFEAQKESSIAYLVRHQTYNPRNLGSIRNKVLVNDKYFGRLIKQI